jgi:hypothetical protein
MRPAPSFVHFRGETSATVKLRISVRFSVIFLSRFLHLKGVMAGCSFAMARVTPNSRILTRPLMLLKATAESLHGPTRSGPLAAPIQRLQRIQTRDFPDTPCRKPRETGFVTTATTRRENMSSACKSRWSMKRFQPFGGTRRVRPNRTASPR